VLRWLGIGMAVLVAVGAIWYANRTDPLLWIAGRTLSGENVETLVDDWSFADQHRVLAVETRPAAPHSVTTLCVVYEGDLYVPALGGSKKTWTQYAVADPRARVKIGGRVYPVTLERVTDAAHLQRLIVAVLEKSNFRSGPDSAPPEDVWIFKVESRPASSRDS